MDGVRNLWIVKPGAQSRGRGIFMMNHLEEILALVQSPLIYETKYVVQKYMGKPAALFVTLKPFLGCRIVAALDRTQGRMLTV